MAKARLAIAVDFGTTYSGVSYKVVERRLGRGGSLNNAERPSQIEWPGDNGTSFKTPSVLCYDTSTDPISLNSFGYKAKRTSSPSFWRLHNFKTRLFVDLSALADSTTDPVARAPLRKYEDATTDFLQEVYHYVLSELCDRDLSPEKMEYHVLFTTPGTFQPKHVADFRDLVRATDWGKHSIYVTMPEPEAAARHTIRNSMPENFVEGDCFVLCDAGGGTVDVISYQLVSIDKSTRNTPAVSVDLEQTTVVNGDTFGSTLIDRRFREHFKSCIGQEQCERLTNHERHDIMNSFIAKKERFKNDISTPNYFIDVPEYLRGDNISTARSQFKLSREDMLELFEASVKGTLDLIKSQVSACGEQNLTVKSIFLVGGLGSSIYLHDRVQEYADEHSINVIQPSNADCAVVLGAAVTLHDHLRGLRDAIRAYRCQAHYGILCSRPWDGKKHAPQADERMVDELTGKKVAVNQIQWIVSKGERIEGEDAQKNKNHFFRRCFPVLPTDRWYVSVVVSDEDVAPTRFGPGRLIIPYHRKSLDFPLRPEKVRATKLITKQIEGVRKLYDLPSDKIEEAPDGIQLGGKIGKPNILKRRKRYWKCDFQIVASPGVTDLDFIIVYGGKPKTEPLKAHW